MEREFDVIVWGATGFTGRLVAHYLYNAYGLDGELKWAIAGRSQSKLQQIAEKIAGENGPQIPQVLADTGDQESIEELTQKTKVVCTTVGPYALYGTVLVEACVKYGTHCCDLTGEVQWMRKIIDQYQTAAEESGARIVHTCGFDSIPSDMGVYFLQKQMKAKHDVYAKEAKFRVAAAKGGMSGGTVASLMNMMEEARVDPELEQLLADPYALNPRNTPIGSDQNDQTIALYDMDFRQWTAPFVMAGINTRVVRRSNALLGDAYGKDFKYSESMLTGDGPLGYMKASGVAAGSTVVMLMAAMDTTRKFLKKMLPSPGEGPSPEVIESGFFKIDILGLHPEASDKNMMVRVTGDKDPGYGATSKMLAESAVCLAKDELGVGGGIWTPSSAMGNALLERLIARAGMTFDVC